MIRTTDSIHADPLLGIWPSYHRRLRNLKKNIYNLRNSCEPLELGSNFYSGIKHPLRKRASGRTNAKTRGKLSVLLGYYSLITKAPSARCLQ